MGMSRWCHSPHAPTPSRSTSAGPVPRRRQRQQASAATWPTPRRDDGPPQAAGAREDYPRSRPRACAPGWRTGGPIAVQENERNAGREPAEDAAAAGRDSADQPPAAEHDAFAGALSPEDGAGARSAATATDGSVFADPAGSAGTPASPASAPFADSAPSAGSASSADSAPSAGSAPSAETPV